MKIWRHCLRALGVAALLMCVGSLLGAQTITGSIVGTVVDSSGAVIPGASVALTDIANGSVRAVTSDREGVFRFPNLAASTYSAKITANGFQQLTTTNIQLNASSTRDLGRISLKVGSASQEVTVTAAATPIQTASSEMSHSIEGAALDALPLRGRDVFGAMKLSAGVVDTNTHRDNTAVQSLGGITINGNTSAKNFTVDGITDMDTGANGGVHYEPNMDAIQEVKILSSNYQAEYGRNSGGTITVITKAGTSQFHGSAWEYHRHEQFNANDFFNNENGLPRPLYRYNIAGWSLGGPVPAGWLKNKLFFFASQEYTNQLGSNTVSTKTFPTALERAGDFSQSYTPAGALIKITDPITGAQFPGNTIPDATTGGSACGVTTSCISPTGQAILNFFPQPNFTPAGGSTYGATPKCLAANPSNPAVCGVQANFQQQASAQHPRRNDVVRIDFNPTSKLTTYFRWIRDADDTVAVFQGVPFDIKRVNHPNPGWGYAASGTYVISPTLINTFTWGYTWNTWSWYLMPGAEQQIDRSVVGNPPLLLPLPTSPKGVNGYSNVMPQLNFGGNRPNMAAYTNGNFDYHNANPYWSISDDVSKVAGAHQLKAGLYLEHNLKLQPSGLGYNGSYNFGVDANNPLNTGDGFANALLGYYNSFNQASGRVVFNALYWNAEFYAQDSWRVNRKLNLDLGVRFYHQTPQRDLNHTFATFVPGNYVNQLKIPATSKGILYVPGCSKAMAPGQTCAAAKGKVISVDPNTNVQGPAAYIGSFVPGADPANGMVVPGVGGVPENPYTTKALVAAPRIGFAYDVFGNGKTAIRGGFGIFYNRLDGNQVYNMSGQAPLIYNYQVSQGKMSDLATTQGVIAPSTINFYSGETPIPVVKNASLDWQQALGFQTTLSASYVGNFSTRQNVRQNLNPVPLGANFQTANISGVTGQPLTQVSSAALRPNYPGYLDVNQEIFAGHSNYNALQLQVQHRLSHGVLFGAAYTWSKALGVTDYDSLMTLGQRYQNNDARNYGLLAIDRRQMLNINYSWTLPGVGNRYAGALLNHWTFSGLTSYSAGAPFSPTFTAGGNDYTGSASEGARLNVIGNARANVPAGLMLNPGAFAPPVAKSGDYGNLGVNAFSLPGYMDWDMAFTKFIPAGFTEGAGFSLQVQAFNVFNHPQFTGYGANWSNGNFAQPTADAGARVLAFNVRYQF